MWFKEYNDYKTDKPLIKYQVEPGKGIIGCEMHDLNGWGSEYHISPRRWRSRLLSSFLSLFLKRRDRRKKND